MGPSFPPAPDAVDGFWAVVMALGALVGAFALFYVLWHLGERIVGVVRRVAQWWRPALWRLKFNVKWVADAMKRTCKPSRQRMERAANVTAHVLALAVITLVFVAVFIPVCVAKAVGGVITYAESHKGNAWTFRVMFSVALAMATWGAIAMLWCVAHRG